jgi:hypothetical protein
LHGLILWGTIQAEQTLKILAVSDVVDDRLYSPFFAGHFRDVDADVRECSTRVNISPDLKPEDLEILGEKVDFLERTGLDRIRPGAKIKLTIPDGFDRMLEHVAVHRYFMGLDLQRDISEQEAVAHWYDQVYLPIINSIRRSGILKEFPGKTEGDLYLWVLDRQRYLNASGHKLVSPRRAAEDFLEEVK